MIMIHELLCGLSLDYAMVMNLLSYIWLKALDSVESHTTCKRFSYSCAHIYRTNQSDLYKIEYH